MNFGIMFMLFLTYYRLLHNCKHLNISCLCSTITISYISKDTKSLLIGKILFLNITGVRKLTAVKPLRDRRGMAYTQNRVSYSLYLIYSAVLFAVFILFQGAHGHTTSPFQGSRRSYRSGCQS